MGRLTLIVLLSFAQFEREITGERMDISISQRTLRFLRWLGAHHRPPRVPLTLLKPACAVRSAFRVTLFSPQSYKTPGRRELLRSESETNRV